ncbi:MAG: hypothetical protein EHM23_02965 [Acidobacteria bacterium]|nr:MAG: hypothetical protein EHM23_02965 [Acidobacteriota bacterium]
MKKRLILMISIFSSTMRRNSTLAILFVLVSISGAPAKSLSEIWSKSLRLQVGPYLILKERIVDKDSIDGFVWRLSVKHGQQESIVWDSVRDDSDWLNFAVFDLLGNGSKQLIIEEYTGAAHCCWQQAIYELAAEPKLIYETEGERGGFAIEDFNQDGRWELSFFREMKLPLE